MLQKHIVHIRATQTAHPKNVLEAVVIILSVLAD